MFQWGLEVFQVFSGVFKGFKACFRGFQMYYMSVRGFSRSFSVSYVARCLMLEIVQSVVVFI